MPIYVAPLMKKNIYLHFAAVKPEDFLQIYITMFNSEKIKWHIVIL